jgi:hypothetical protein
MPDTKTVIERLPRAQSITSDHLIQAFIYGSRRQQQRIDAFGRLNRRVLRGIGKPALQDGTVGKTPAARADARRGKKSRHRY